VVTSGFSLTTARWRRLRKRRIQEEKRGGKKGVKLVLFLLGLGKALILYE